MPLALDDALLEASLLEALDELELEEAALVDALLDELATAHVSLSSHSNPQWGSAHRQSK